mmetsp:Transcript_53619/g.160055  ORF Transcript_53619/g.160055 Transcript_53619/m.160055 type:complete len:211 (+) Transcript_53619:453-1085(+)
MPARPNAHQPLLMRKGGKGVGLKPGVLRHGVDPHVRRSLPIGRVSLWRPPGERSAANAQSHFGGGGLALGIAKLGEGNPWRGGAGPQHGAPTGLRAAEAEAALGRGARGDARKHLVTPRGGQHLVEVAQAPHTAAWSEHHLRPHPKAVEEGDLVASRRPHLRQLRQKELLPRRRLGDLEGHDLRRQRRAPGKRPELLQPCGRQGCGMLPC